MNRLKAMLAMLLCLVLPCMAAAEGLKGGKAEIPVLDMEKCDIPDNPAMAFLKDMKIGWNLGNTFDATRDGVSGDEMEIESYWCGIKTTEEMIEAVHAAGFNTLRLPVSWHNHVSGEDFRISQPWLDRVQEVADWAISRGMYVIINTHHDVYEEYYYPDEAHYAQSEKYITSIWAQLAERFRDYDEHLIFESMNEPRLKGTDNEWWFDARSEKCKESAACINRLNQAFVDTVRASGGYNASRYLMVPAYCASEDNATGSYFTLPQDEADNRIIVSVHAYTPYNFALQEGNQTQFSVSSQRQTREIDSLMNDLYKKYIANGIPVVIGEFGARNKDNNLQDRVNFASYYIAAASARGIPCCWWDNNAFTGNGENFGLLRRIRSNWLFPDIVIGMMQYAMND